MLKILIKDKIDAFVIEEFQNRGFELTISDSKGKTFLEEVQENEILIVRSATQVTREVIDVAHKTELLKLIIRAGVGLDNIDVHYAQAKGIRVLNTPGASSSSVAELALAHMFTLIRMLVPANLTMRKSEWNKNKYFGMELSGKNLGIIGMGRIGQTLAKKASALGMQILYYDIAIPEGIDQNWKCLTLDEVLVNADFISLHVSADHNNGFLIDEPELEKMKKGAFLINTARGSLVNENALLKALESGKIAGAGIDVFCHEPCDNIALLQNERISVTPHIGASTREAQFRIGQEIIRLVLEFQKNKNK